MVLSSTIGGTMKAAIRILLIAWSILIFVEGIRTLIPTINIFQYSSLFPQIPSLNSTGLLLVWAAFLSVFATLNNDFSFYPHLSSLEMKIENPFDFHEDIFGQYEERLVSLT
jgi:hypothetical protein